MRRVARGARLVLLGIAFVSPLASHVALASGWGLHVALALAAVQAGAVGLIIWESVRPGWARLLAPVATVLLLSALTWGTAQSPAEGLAAAAGTSHALFYCGLLALFGHTLLPGHVPLVTRIAHRVNTVFHDGMEAYTRSVTVAWSVFFAAQLLVSAGLLLTNEGWWAFYVSTLHMPLVILMAVGEYAVRRSRFRGKRVTSLLNTIRAAGHAMNTHSPPEAPRSTSA